jgi:hypothetical protein
MRLSRANALPETALVLSLVMLLLSAAIQSAAAAYTEISADGAAFVSAHGAVQHYAAPNVAASPGIATLAQTIAHNVFNRIRTTDVTVKNPDNASFESTVTESVPGFTLLPGSPATFTITGRDVEAQQPIGPVGGNLLGFQNLPTLPGSTKCPSLTGSSSLLGNTGSTINSTALTALGSQTSGLNKVLGDTNGLMTALNSVLGGTSFATAITSSVTGALTSSLGGLLSGLLAPATNALTGTSGPVGTAVTNVLQSITTSALAGTAPTASSISSALATALLGPVTSALGAVSALLLPLVSTIVNAIVANLMASIFTPLIAPLTAVAGDHSTASTLLNGPCS